MKGVVVCSVVFTLISVRLGSAHQDFTGSEAEKLENADHVNARSEWIYEDTKWTCEDGYVYITCPGFDQVIVTLEASYGRFLHSGNADRMCGSDYKGERCSVEGIQQARNHCDGQRSCRFKVENNLFGPDPCYGVTKYMKVRYRCPKRENDDEPYYVYSCEPFAAIFLECPDNKKVKVLSAYYGRRSPSRCDPRIIHQSGDTSICYSDITSFLANECRGKDECGIMFPITYLKNPEMAYLKYECPDTSKYLEATYRCE